MTRGRQSGHQGEWCECTKRCPMLTIPLLPDAGPSHGALDSGPGPLGDATASFRGGSPSSRPRVASPGGSRRPDRARLRPLSRLTLGLRPQTIRALQMSALNFGHAPSATRRPPEEAHPQNHGLRPCPGWPTALRSSAFVQATTVRSAAPQTFAVELGIVPQAAGAQVRRLHTSSFPGPCQRPSVFTERRFAIPSCHHSCHAASTVLPAVNGGERRAASATRTAASTALPAQCVRQRAPRCQRNA